MTLPRLDNDCIYYIIKFSQYNRSTLFNFLLVNRFWCKVTVPLLYTNPFSPNLKSKSKILIVKTFLLCLNEEEKKYLIKQDNVCNMKKFFQDNNNLKPTFEYPKYIKYLSKSLIYNIIDFWFKKQKIDTCNLLKVAFYHMFLRQSDQIKELGIVSDIFDENIFDINYINTFINISNLTTLQLHYSRVIEHEIFSKFLQKFVEYCKNIKQISLEQFEQDHHLYEISSIINNQYKLKEFDYYIHTVDKLSSNIIFDSLEYQKDSLVSLKLHNITFEKLILQSIIKLYNLKSFEMDSFYNMTSEFCEIFEFASFKLKRLIIRNKFCDNDITTKIIKYLGLTLKILKIKYITNEIMEKLVQYNNLDLDTLDIEYTNHNLLILHYLKNLKVKYLNLFLDSYLDDEIFFIKLAESLSETTSHISFINRKFLNMNILSNFLNKCHNYLISLSFKWKCGLGHLKVILNYIKKKNNNNLKYLRIGDKNIDWNVEELEILRQIKEKGVKLTQFIDNYKEYDYSYSD
ncbi:hypothetical protein RhiirC2_771074 [Rhizophagus irregularis]|uniref:F-box domain-containing protein n=1 Tax=Rhizophagus irregularis TaxID=588596 RepID=A0A2N1NUT3_9GLOM|nr:hypothetical protein RhiirC2_771074 [Rhizophagus irregularis]